MCQVNIYGLTHLFHSNIYYQYYSIIRASEMARVTYELKGLKRIVRATGLTYHQVADLCDIGGNHFISILHCQARSSPTTTNKIAQGLNVSVSKLISPPNVESAIYELTDEIRRYRVYCQELYKASGVTLPDIT